MTSFWRTIFSWRIFWYANLQEAGTGHWMHQWVNHATGSSYVVFAGYNKRALNKLSSTFIVAQDRFLNEWKR